jgi:hypothetical protein
VQILLLLVGVAAAAAAAAGGAVAVAQIWSMEATWYPLKPVGSKADGVLNYRFKDAGLPRAAMADLKGDPLNPLFLCSFTRADKNARLFYESVIETARECGSTMMCAPETPIGRVVETLHSDANFEIMTEQGEWDRKWSTEATVLATGKCGRKQLFDMKALNAAIKEFRDEWGPKMQRNNIALQITKITNNRLGLPKAHSQHMTKQHKCVCLAEARRIVWAELARAPADYDLSADWAVPPRPENRGLIKIRATGSGVEDVLDGHLAGNVNPDHTHVLFV